MIRDDFLHQCIKIYKKLQCNSFVFPAAEPPEPIPSSHHGGLSRGCPPPNVDLLETAKSSQPASWYDNSSLRPQLLPPPSRRLPPPASMASVASQKTVSPAADNEVGGCMGPIYEDIDRMCSYTGYPPDSYYNLSGGSSPRNKSSNRSAFWVWDRIPADSFHASM